MKNYIKPSILLNDDFSEGVFAASGAVDCYTFAAKIAQKPELGRPYYVIQIDGRHRAEDGHHSDDRKVVVVFNKAVTYVSSKAESCEGSGTNSLTLDYHNSPGGAYHSNSGMSSADGEYIGLGDLNVTADQSGEELRVISAYCIYCSRDCEDPTHH